MRTKKKYFMPQWALTKIENLAKFYETTKTQALLMMISKGSNYYEKEMKKAGFLKDNTTEKPAKEIAPKRGSLENNIPEKKEEIKDEWEKDIENTIRIARAKIYQDD